MRNVAIALLLGLTLPAASAFASPIVSVDGLFNASDVYWFSLADDTGEPGLAGGGLDISSVSFQEDDDYYYLGLQVAAEPISRTGGPTSFIKRTVFNAFFIDMANPDSPSLLHELSVIMNATQIYVYLDGMPLLSGADYVAAASSGLEVAISKPLMAAMSGVSSFLFQAQLDDTGSYSDDQIAGMIPEPVTMGLVSIGGLLLLRRRK